MSTYFKNSFFSGKTVPQIDDFEREFSTQVSHINNLDDENLLNETIIKRQQLKTASFEPRKFLLDYFYAEQNAAVTIDTNFTSLTGTSINVIYPGNNIYRLWIIAGFVTPNLAAGKSWTAEILLDGVTQLNEITHDNNAVQNITTLHMCAAHNVTTAGNHTLLLRAKVGATTETQRNSWMHVITFAN